MVCGLIGAATVGATLAISRGGEEGPSAAAAAIATEEYGRRLLTDTSRLMGPDHDDPARRQTGIRMACASCHLGGGTEPGTLSLLQSAAVYPRFSGRDGGVRDLVDRINGCMTRSMNGRELPRDSPEMVAMVAYVTSLGDVYAAMGEGQRKVDETDRVQDAIARGRSEGRPASVRRAVRYLSRRRRRRLAGDAHSS